MAIEEEKAKLEIELERGRSKVRRVCTYSGVGIIGFLVIYGTVWMGDRSAFLAGLSIFGPLLGFYFGTRSGDKVLDKVLQAINKLK